MKRALQISMASVLTLTLLVGASLSVGLVPGDYQKEHRGDPRNDVQVFDSTTQQGLLSSGRLVFSSEKGEVDLREVSSQMQMENVTISAVVHGTIPSSPSWENMSFIFDLYTDAEDRVHYKLNWTGGPTGGSWLYSNGSGFAPIDITGNASVESTYRSDDTLKIEFPIALIPSVTSWDIDVSSEERGPNYTFRDFIYQVPGHPGTAPSAISGHVYEGVGRPVAGATVSTDIGGYQNTTDALGYYTLYLAPGSYNLSASAEGYHESKVHVTVGSAQSLENVDINIAPMNAFERMGTLGYLAIAAVALSLSFLTGFVILRRRRMGRLDPPGSGPGAGSPPP